MTSEERQAQRCQHCDEPRSEHKYDGACYGKCGSFVEPPTDRYKKLFEQIDRWAIAGLCAGTHTGAREFLKDIRRELDNHNLGDGFIPFRE